MRGRCRILVGLGALLLSVPALAHAGARAAERVPLSCAAEWSPADGWTYLALVAPDTPQYPGNITGFFPFTFAAGEGVFAPSGRMSVTCHQGNAFVTPAGSTWNGQTACILFRGGQDFSLKGARVYRGHGHVVVTPAKTVTMTCQGRFVGIANSPSDIP